MKKIKNKKGFAVSTIIIFLAILGAVGIFSGWFVTYKIEQTINSIPTWAWIGLILLFVLLILPKKK